MDRGERLLDLVSVMDRLRSPGGCPWDAEQTHRSLVEYVVEEAYELVEAIENGDDEGIREELGDLLLQVVFHARIAEEKVAKPWNVDDVAQGIVDKLIRRHPHVFDAVYAGETARSGVEREWHVQKAREKGRDSVVDGIPEGLPALMRVGKVEQRSASLQGQLPEIPQARRAEAIVDGCGSPDDLGELLMAVAASARSRGWDAEGAVRQAVRRRIDVIRSVEAEGKT